MRHPRLLQQVLLVLQVSGCICCCWQHLRHVAARGLSRCLRCLCVRHRWLLLRGGLGCQLLLDLLQGA
jgi:hypothetical protein